MIAFFFFNCFSMEVPSLEESKRKNYERLNHIVTKKPTKISKKMIKLLNSLSLPDTHDFIDNLKQITKDHPEHNDEINLVIERAKQRRDALVDIKLSICPMQ